MRLTRLGWWALTAALILVMTGSLALAGAVETWTP